MADQTEPSIKERSEAHLAYRETNDFKSQFTHINGLTQEFLMTVTITEKYSTRIPKFTEQSMLFNATGDIIESAIAILSLVSEGMFFPVRRELRYMLESTTKFLYVDQQVPAEDLSDKIAYFDSAVPNASIDIVSEIALDAFDEPTQHQFKDEVKDAFVQACRYVHPSKRQYEQRLDREKKGTAHGFEVAKELIEINSLIQRCYDLILVMYLHGIGTGMAGDLFINAFDTMDRYKFYKTKYVKLMSSTYDYKAERQVK